MDVVVAVVAAAARLFRIVVRILGGRGGVETTQPSGLFQQRGTVRPGALGDSTGQSYRKQRLGAFLLFRGSSGRPTPATR